MFELQRIISGIELEVGLIVAKLRTQHYISTFTEEEKAAMCQFGDDMESWLSKIPCVPPAIGGLFTNYHNI